MYNSTFHCSSKKVYIRLTYQRLTSIRMSFKIQRAPCYKFKSSIYYCNFDCKNISKLLFVLNFINWFTAGIWNSYLSWFWMVKKRLICKWFRFQMGSEIWEPNQNDCHLAFTNWNLYFLSGFQVVATILHTIFDFYHLKTDLQKVRILNVS